MTPLFFGKPEFHCEKIYEDNGLRLKPIIQIGSTVDQITLPFVESPKRIQEFVSKLADAVSVVYGLQDLWLSDYIVTTQNRDLWLPYDKLYVIPDQEIWQSINLPEIVNVGITLRAIGEVGRAGFHIIYAIEHPIYKTIKSNFLRKGILIETLDTSFIVPQTTYDLLKEVDNYPEDNIYSQTQYLAKVRSMGLERKAFIDSYIEKEEYLFPRSIEINVNKIDNANIEILSNLKGIPEELQDKAFEAGDQDKSVSTNISNDGKRIRVILPSEVKKDIGRFQRKKIISGSDVPKFVQNPEAYIPEAQTVSLEDFSDRVKELSIVTYRAQPFIRARESQKKGWFDFDVGINLEPTSENSSIISLSEEEYSNLIEKAKNEGEEYIQHPVTGAWINIDSDQGEKFINAIHTMREQYPQGSVDASRIPYVLRIFENINTLEYDKTLVEIRKNLIDEDLFDNKNPKPLLDNVVLHEFQRDGYRWMRVLKNASLGGLLADDMGLGKTLQVITFLSYLYENNKLRSTLIVAPLTLIENWKSEIKKFTRGLGLIYVHQGPLRIHNKEAFEEYDIILTTYETLVRDQILFGQVDWKVVILDEAQKIKNTTTMASNVAKALKADNRIALTGTPVENGLNELWCIMDFVQPGLLGAYQEFRRKYELPIQRTAVPAKEIIELTNELHERIKPVYLRRTKDEKLVGLPDKKELKSEIQLSEVQKNLYILTIQRFRHKEINFFSALSSLMQICSHPALVTGEEGSDLKHLLRDCPKLGHTFALLDDIERAKEKVIIFTKYKKMQNILCRMIEKKYGFWPLVINGEITDNRIDIVRSFEKKDGFNIFVLSPRAAGVGLTITGANHVIHYTREWNPAVECQATDRVHRMGQERDVKVYYPISISDGGTTVEQRLDELLLEKKQLIKRVIVPHDKLTITEKDFEGLF